MFFRDQVIGKYKILSTIGSGGFGTVYLAEDTWIDKKVALKVPHKQSVDFSELLREPRLLASLNHPNIVTIMTAEMQEHVFFIVMEYVPGETLESVIARRGPLDVPVALDYTCQICNALDHAHRQGVLHRDLRPSNMLVSESGLLKVADFGTSRFLEIAAHGTTIIGSPPYMAPEQFQGKALFASDIYSVGVTMFQMLTGDLPYDTPTPSDLERLLKGELRVSVRARNPKVPRTINDIVLKAMAPEVHARYQRAADLLDDIFATRDKVEPARAPRATPPSGESSSEGAQDIQTRLRARETPQARFCWHCRKPLHARTDRADFILQSQGFSRHGCGAYQRVHWGVAAILYPIDELFRIAPVRTRNRIGPEHHFDFVPPSVSEKAPSMMDTTALPTTAMSLTTSFSLLPSAVCLST